MIPRQVRLSLALMAACGAAASVFVYIESCCGVKCDQIPRWLLLLGVGALAVQLPIPVMEHASLVNRRFFWGEFSRGMPSWVVPCIKLFWLVALAHFVYFLLQSHAAVPIIEDGQYILSNRGRIVKVLTHPEYLALKALEARLFAALTFVGYLMPFMYWWFPKQEIGRS
jgi:hypothetical protein